MDREWEILIGAGLPDGPPRPVSGPLAVGPLRDAMRSLVVVLPEPREREILAAWLGAFRDHWPRAFAEVLGPEGEGALARLLAQPIDGDRYLKLRRIAIENLSRLL